MRILSLAIAVCLLVACGGGGKEPTTPRVSKHKGVHAFYPFENGMQWTYSVRGPGGAMGMLKVDKVVAFDGSIALVQDAKTTNTYRLTPEGITREPSHAILLKWPIVLGDTWDGAKGAKVEVTKVDAKITVDAGTFDGCVETTERIGGDAASVLVTTFCPDVGPVIVDIREVNPPPGEPPAQLTARLRAFGPAAELPPKETH